MFNAIELYEILSTKLGKAEAKVLAQCVETKVEEQLTNKTNVFATKSDIADVRLEIREAELRLTRNIFIAGVVQFLAIVGSVLMIMKFRI